MNELEFVEIGKKLVRDCLNEMLNLNLSTYDIYMVWCCKTLQNNKGLFSSNLSDGLYFEITYNGNKKEIYLDVYRKQFNKKISL